jgi:hypothetical protein
MKRKDWRDESSINMKIVYIKRFAWLPVTLEDGTRIVWKNYYKGIRYVFFNTRLFRIEKDKLGNISADDYLIKRLVGTVHTLNDVLDTDEDH